MKYLFAVSLIIIIPLSTIKAETSLNSELANCAAIKRDLQRLACYDNLSDMAKTSPEEILSKKTSSSVARNTIENSVSDTRPSTASPSDSSFGLIKKDEGPESISSYIPGEFKGWTNGDKLTLANGQVWKIKDSSGRFYHSATDPRVTISKGMFGSYRISIDGINKSARVKRVK